MTGTAPSGAPWRNFYGRRRGKTLRVNQRQHLAADLGELQPFGVSWEDNPTRQPLDLNALFGETCPVWLEIGFGGGEHIVHQASLNPDTGIIGCEPFINGVAMLLGKIRQAGVSNLRIHPGDVRDLMDILPKSSISKAFLLYPDPWPKRRHHRRRFVTPEHLDPLAHVLTSGAELRIATDISDYIRQTKAEMDKHCAFALTSCGSKPWADWVPTRYEKKALREGRQPCYMSFRRL